MKLGVVEFELRSLPGVIAATVDEQAVTVLVLPDADADALEVVISAVLATHGIDADVRVLGGRASPSLAAGRGRRVLVGAVGGVGVLATVAAATAMSGRLPFGPEPETRLAAPAASEAPARTPAPVKRSGTTIVPGDQPLWAANEGAWPLPAALPVVPPALASASAVTVVPAPAVDVSADPRPAKQPRGVPHADPIVTTGAPPASDANAAPEVTATPEANPTPEANADRAEADATPEANADHADSEQWEHPSHDHEDQGLHRGWENGPAHAAPQSSASSTPSRNRG